jgi:hypothetical protein
MEWDVRFDLEFLAWFNGLIEALQDEILAHIALLRERGPNLGRPYVDITPARKFRKLRHTNPTRQRGECSETLAGASG